jgi:SulP family sulfate permease
MAGHNSHKPSWVSKFIPITAWLRQYTRQEFNSDIFAGIITAILFVPQGIAYAMLAGLPAQVGLYASILPPLIYAFLGTSRTLSVGPVSIAAIMIASALAAPELAAFGSPVEHAIILAAEGGFILLAMAVFQMGGLVKFISHPVLSGFTSGAAILIIFSQLPHLFGIEVKSCGADVGCIVEHAQHINPFTAGLGLFSFVLLLSMGKPLSAWLTKLNLSKALVTGISRTAPLLAVVITTSLVTFFQLAEQHAVAVVGQIPAGLPDIRVFSIFTDSNHWLALLPSAIFISVIAYVESVAIALVTANLRNQKIDTNQELIALGTANLATAFSGGMSVAGGFSRTMVNFSAGARTQLAMIIAVGLLALSLIYFTDQFTNIPKATLAAIILIAIAPLIKFKEIFHTLKFDRADAVTQTLTLLSVLILGIEEGIALGVLVTFIVYLRRTSLPHIAVVGRVAGTEQFRNIERHDVETWPNLLMIRIDENITFANIGFITDCITRKADEKADLEHIILIFSSVSYIDTTAFDALKSLTQSLKNHDIVLNLAEVKGPVMDKLIKMNFEEHLLGGQIFFHTSDAIKQLTSPAS